MALDAATHTVYVANGNNDNGPDVGGNTVSVIDARRCQAHNVSHCLGPWPTITVGNLPSTIAVDQVTDTVYVTNSGDNTVSVFNGATCNATYTLGCGQTPATVPVGVGPLGIFTDDANHTVYVTNFGATTVSMIDSSVCNAANLASCPTSPPPVVDVGMPPGDVVVNAATHTVYVATLLAISVFDADTCNATVHSGCATRGTLTGDPFSGPNGFEIDPANDTLYTANYDNTISAWDLRGCNATDLADCAAQAPGNVLPFPYTTDEHALWLVVDVALHSVYVAYQRDDALIVVDTNVCNGAHLAACATLHPPAARTGAQPEAVILDPHTQTLYTANQTDNDVSVINASTCNAQRTTGCRQAPTAIPVPTIRDETDHRGLYAGPFLAADAAVHTLYEATNSSSVSIINTATCNGLDRSGCDIEPRQVTVGPNPSAIAVDSAAHTVYVANFGSTMAAGPGTVSVINADTCNATDSTGCAHPATIHVAVGNAYNLAVDQATHTLYVATIAASGPDHLAVFNTSSCRAGVIAGCNQKPTLTNVGDSGGQFDNSLLNLAVNATTNTIYATDVDGIATGNTSGDSIFVIDGAHCDADVHTGCARAPVVVTTGAIPWGLAVDEATNTIYSVLENGGDYPGRIAVIDGATCDGANHTDCATPAPTTSAGFGVNDIAIDPTTQLLYTTNHEDASLSVIDARTCNRLTIGGCSQPHTKLPAGNYPTPIAVDPAVHTAYVATQTGISVIPLHR